MALEKCPHCGLPQPPGADDSLHRDTCQLHDETTCLGCKAIEHGDALPVDLAEP